MKAIIDNDTIQIEWTNVCRLNCSNCTRFCHHVVKPYFMDFETFKHAVDSMSGFQKMVGAQGGEPLLHPDFEKMCAYLRSKFHKEQLGLWTTLPKGYEHYREVICNTFHHIFINDHTRNDIYHHPGLVAIEEVIEDKNIMWQMINKCWAQEGWSASINPRGAFFCEIAASLAMLFDKEESMAWKVEQGWWNRIPKDFTAQMEKWCPRCGFAAPLKRRASIEGIDDISQGNYDRIKDSSPKIKRGEYKISNLLTTDCPEPMAAYKDFTYRDEIARRYGMFLYINKQGFWTPVLSRSDIPLQGKSMIEMYREKFK